MTLSPRTHRLALSLAAFSIFVAVTLGTPLLAGADWPTTPDTAPNDQSGVCNIQYDVTGPVELGYVITFNCNLAVKTTGPDAVWIQPFICGNLSGRGITCPTADVDGAPIADEMGETVKLTTPGSGSTSCDVNHTLWIGYIPHSGQIDACTNPVSDTSWLTTTPPAIFTTSADLYGYVNISDETYGTASNGLTPVSVEGSFTNDLDTYAGATGPTFEPENVWLNSSGTCSDFSTDNANTLLTGMNDAATFSNYDTSTNTSYGELEVQNVTCKNSLFGYPTAPNGGYNGGAPPINDGPCTLDGVTGNGSSDQPKANYDYPYNIDFDGATQLIVVDPEDGSTPTQTIDGKTFSANANLAHAPPETSPVTIDVQIATNTGGIDPHLWCYNQGTWYDWGYVEDDQTVSTTACTVDCSQSQVSICLGDASSGMDLYNPVTWVTGIVEGATCIIQWILVPSLCTPGDQDTTTCVDLNGFVADADTHEPFSWIADATNAYSTVKLGIETATDDGACDSQTIAPWSGDTGIPGKWLATISFTPPAPSDLGCTGPNSTTVGNLLGARPWLYAFLEFGFWLSTLALIWKMLPVSKTGDFMESIEKAGGLDTLHDFLTRGKGSDSL